MLDASGSNAVGTDCALIGTYNAYLYSNSGQAATISIDTTGVTSLNLTYWIREGADACSENPEVNEDLIIEYNNNLGNWITFDEINSTGNNNGISYNRTHTLSSNIAHNNFKLRFRKDGGTSGSWDYWHFDEVRIEEVSSGGSGGSSSSSNYNLAYDANGNLVTGDGYYRVYNTLNQLWKVYNGSSTSGNLLEEYTMHPTEERVLIKKVYYTNTSLKETVYYVSDEFVRVINTSETYTYRVGGGQPSGEGWTSSSGGGSGGGGSSGGSGSSGSQGKIVKIGGGYYRCKNC